MVYAGFRDSDSHRAYPLDRTFQRNARAKRNRKSDARPDEESPDGYGCRYVSFHDGTIPRVEFVLHIHIFAGWHQQFIFHETVAGSNYERIPAYQHPDIWQLFFRNVVYDLSSTDYSYRPGISFSDFKLFQCSRGFLKSTGILFSEFIYQTQYIKKL
jgi:hypothetical protein